MRWLGGGGLVQVGSSGAEKEREGEKRVKRRGGRRDEWTSFLCHRCDGQLQLEHAPMHCRCSGQRFEWLENIPPYSIICIERTNQ